MKLFGEKIEIEWDHISWSPHYLPNDPAKFGSRAGTFWDYVHYIYWANWLDKDHRYIGYEQDWYDGPISSFGFWFCNISWVLPWTSHNGKWGWSYNPWVRKRRKEMIEEARAKGIDLNLD